MGRPKIKLVLLLIAVGSTVYWAQPPYLWGPMMGIGCGLWAVIALAAFRWDRAEDWTYRLSSFLGMALATTEGVAGILGLTTRAGLLVMALLHFIAFILSVTGRYQKVASKRVQRAL